MFLCTMNHPFGGTLIYGNPYMLHGVEIFTYSPISSNNDKNGAHVDIPYMEHTGTYSPQND